VTKKSPAERGFPVGLPTVVATVPIAAATAAEIQTDAWTTAAVVAPMMVAIWAPMNLFRSRRDASFGEARKT
jgi:hypothetical protein